MSSFIFLSFMWSVDYLCGSADPREGFVHHVCCKLTECHKTNLEICFFAASLNISVVSLNSKQLC